MKHGFISVACGAPPLRLADCDYNAEQTFLLMRKAEKAGVKVLVLPVRSSTWTPTRAATICRSPGRPARRRARPPQTRCTQSEARIIYVEREEPDQ